MQLQFIVRRADRQAARRRDVDLFTTTEVSHSRDERVHAVSAAALCGFVVANMVPAFLASAGRVGGKAAGRAISIVTIMGCSGLLLGPAVLGFLAQATTLVVSFSLILVAFLAIAGMTLPLDRRLKQSRSE
jgi:fucose permease